MAFLTIPVVPARFSDHHSLGVPKHAAADLPAHNNRRQKPGTAPKLEGHARLSVSLHASQNIYRSPRRKSGECCCNGVQTAQQDFSERGRPGNYTRTYYSRATSARGEKNKKRDHCQRSQLYGSSDHPQQTTTATGQQLQQQQSSSKRARIDARTTRRPHTNKAPSRATNAAAAAERSGRRRQQTDYPSPDRGPENRKIASNVTSHVLPFPPPIVRDIVMSYVPIFVWALSLWHLPFITSYVTSHGSPKFFGTLSIIIHLPYLGDFELSVSDHSYFVTSNVFSQVPESVGYLIMKDIYLLVCGIFGPKSLTPHFVTSHISPPPNLLMTRV